MLIHTQRVVTSARVEEFEQVRTAVSTWADAEEAIEAVALVGSWARGQARMDSDIDVVVLTESDHFIEREDWITEVCGGQAVLERTADWGGVIERRVRLGTGLEIEFGFGRPAWAGVTPVDPGTREVIADGCQTWYDPNGILQQLLRSVAN